MGLASKLNLKPGLAIRVEGKPDDVDLDDVAVATGTEADAILVFATSLAELDTRCTLLVEAARRDGLAWVAYPKARRLRTDLNRDVLWAHLQKHGVEGVRLVAIDDTWTAMRFRPAAGA